MQKPDLYDSETPELMLPGYAGKNPPMEID